MLVAAYFLAFHLTVPVPSIGVPIVNQPGLLHESYESGIASKFPVLSIGDVRQKQHGAIGQRTISTGESVVKRTDICVCERTNVPMGLLEFPDPIDSPIAAGGVLDRRQVHAHPFCIDSVVTRPDY